MHSTTTVFGSGFSKEDHEMEVVNVRVRMVVSSEPFEPVRRPLVRGDGQQALTGIGRCISTANYTIRRCTTARHWWPVILSRPGDDHGIQFGNDASAG